MFLHSCCKNWSVDDQNPLRWKRVGVYFVAASPPPLYIAELVKQNGYFRSQKCGICTFVLYNTHLAPVAILTK